MPRFAHYEFFAGGGMARAGLGDIWTCLFANDFDAMKAETYRRNWGGGEMVCADVASVTTADLPGRADLAWASFPCQDLSLAGGQRGLGEERDNAHSRSGAFWPFWRLMRALGREGRRPRAIALENVVGALTSHGGRDFAALAEALADEGYRFGALVIDAALFVPQSRPRLFVIAFADDVALDMAPVATTPDPLWTPAAVLRAHANLSEKAKARWLWWRPAPPPPRAKVFADLIEAEPTGVAWRTPAQTDYLLSLMTPVHRAKVAAAQASGERRIGAVYRRTRMDENGARRQRAEVRFDAIAGCLRTPAGGSSRQTLLVVEGASVRSRLLSPREAARLMGLPDSYMLPASYNAAYHVCGDGVCVDAVRYLRQTLLEPVLARRETRLAAE